MLVDTAGQERFDSITPMLYHKADVFVLVYDITERTSFEHLRKWMNDINHYKYNIMTDGTKVMLIGNKTDLEDKRAVSYKEGMKFAEENHMHFFETSAKTGANVKEAFEHLINELVEHTKCQDAYEKFMQSVQLPASANVQQTNQCCFSSTSTQSYTASGGGKQHSNASFQTTEPFMQHQSYAAQDVEIEKNVSTLSKCMCTHF